MRLERLELTDFRNYAALRLDPRPGLNLVLGANAQGKSNLLEALGLLALARSPRAARDGDLVRWGADEAVVRGEASRSAREPLSLSVTLRRDGAKSLKVNGIARRRLADGVGELNAVCFAPRDLELVRGAPGDRREFLNTCFGQIDPGYLAALGGYRRLLRQRNSLLKGALHRRLDEHLLLALDDGLAEHAAHVMRVRAERILQLAAAAAEAHARLSAAHERLEVCYAPNIVSNGGGDLVETVRERLIAKRGEELRRGLTLVGPHRDDLTLTLDGAEARSFASQGQQRTAALALKVAELQLIAQTIGESPLLLLDDVLSELDATRQAQVLALTNEAEQVFVTCAEPPRELTASVIWRVAAGRVHEECP